MAKVSVVITTHNRSNLLSGAITSVLNQTFQDFEIIVVDDASKDDTKDVVQTFDDTRIRYIRHETNKGVTERETPDCRTPLANILDSWTMTIDGCRRSFINRLLCWTAVQRWSLVYMQVFSS